MTSSQRVDGPTYEPFPPAVLGQMAQRLSLQGWTALPVRIWKEGESWKKRPLYKNYLAQGPMSHTQILRMNSLQPTHMGLVVPPGYVALDFDVSGEDLLAVIARLEYDWGPLPPGITQGTPSGGLHLLLRHPWEAEFRFASRVSFKDGSIAPVDVIHAGHRFLVVYDPGFPGVAPNG